MENLLEVLDKAQKLASDFSNENMFADTEFTVVNPITPDKYAGFEIDKPKNWKKPKDMPRRPLSAYNLFFKSERQKIVSSISSNVHQKGRNKKALGIGFAGLARVIASRWKLLESEDKFAFEEQAKLEKLRYRNQISVWKSKQAIKKCSKSATLTCIKDLFKPTSDVTMSIDCATCNTSDVTARSHNKQLKHFQDDTGRQNYPIPDLPLSGTESVSSPSIDCPHDNESNDYSFDTSSCPSVVEPVLEDNFFRSNNEPYADSCWKVLVSNLHFESGRPTEPVQDYVDELAAFMETMEKECL